MLTRLVVVMPAYNEAEGIRGFIEEIQDAVSDLTAELTIVVADDQSTDGTAAALEGVAGVIVERQPVNRGHGPTALAAYRAGLAQAPDLLVHVDGDGQFLGGDIARLVRAAINVDADVVHGVRRDRTDPWYRRVLTASAGSLVALAAGRRIPDVNTPLRAYRPRAAQFLVDAVPAEALVPHVHFSLAEARAGLNVRYLRVRSIPRRGESTSGTMWGGGVSLKLPPARLRAFARHALVELWRLSIAPGAPLRGIRYDPFTD